MQQVCVDACARPCRHRGRQRVAASTNRSTSRRDPGRRRLTTTAPDVVDRLDHRRHVAQRRLRRAPVPPASCSGLPSKSVISIVVAGAQELTGVQVAVDPVRGDQAGVAQRLQHVSDLLPRRATPTRRVDRLPAAGRPSPARRLPRRSTIDGCRSASAVCSRAVIAPIRRGRLDHVGRTHSVPSSHASTSSTYQSQPSSGPGRYDVTIACDHVVVFVDTDERRHLVEAGGGEMADQLHAGVRSRHRRAQPLDHDRLVDDDAVVGLVDGDRALDRRTADRAGVQPVRSRRLVSR